MGRAESRGPDRVAPVHAESRTAPSARRLRSTQGCVRSRPFRSIDALRVLRDSAWKKSRRRTPRALDAVPRFVARMERSGMRGTPIGVPRRLLVGLRTRTLVNSVSRQGARPARKRRTSNVSAFLARLARWRGSIFGRAAVCGTPMGHSRWSPAAESPGHSRQGSSVPGCRLRLHRGDQSSIVVPLAPCASWREPMRPGCRCLRPLRTPIRPWLCAARASRAR